MIKVGDVCRIKSPRRLKATGWKDIDHYWRPPADSDAPPINKLMVGIKVVVESKVGQWRSRGVGQAHYWHWHVDMLDPITASFEERTV